MSGRSFKSRFYRLENVELAVIPVPCEGPVTVRSNVIVSYFLGLDIKLTISLFILSSYSLFFLVPFFYESLCREESSFLIFCSEFFREVLPVDHFVTNGFSIDYFDVCL